MLTAFEHPIFRLCLLNRCEDRVEHRARAEGDGGFGVVGLVVAADVGGLAFRLRQGFDVTSGH